MGSTLVPSSFVALESLPLTSSGKLNRRALPTPDRNGHEREAKLEGHVAPQTRLEKRLAAIWSELLEGKIVGLNDNFFELGGHSLLAVRLFAQIEKAFGRNLPLATLFQAPTVKKLAHVL